MGKFRGKTLEEILHLCLKLPSSEWEVSEVVQRGTGASVLPGLAFGALWPNQGMWAMDEGGQMQGRGMIKSFETAVGKAFPTLPSTPAIKVVRFTDPGEATEAGFELSTCAPTVIILSTHISLVILIT